VAWTSFFLIALVCGVVWLGIGLYIGMRLGRRSAGPGLDAQHVQNWVGELTQWTSAFHRDVADYREEMEILAERVNTIRADGEAPGASIVLDLLSQILSANQRLKQRLGEAETRLSRQSVEMQGYLSEARTDCLTHLPNRRALDEELSRRLAEWRRYKAPFSVALLDIDRFKEINDRFGHLAGDRVLTEVALAVRTTMRDADFVARFGGEEFAIVMPATTEAAAFRAVERAREAVEKIAVEADRGEIRPTVSCGAAQVRDDEEMNSLLQRVDAALYTSKFAGRNQSHWHDGVRCVMIANTWAPAAAEQAPVISA
jgi:diguanylate cyclase